MSDIITTLHPKTNASDNLYPNIKGANIPDNAITTTKLNDDAVTTTKLNDGAVTTTKLNDGAVTNDKIQDSTITGVKIANKTITGGKIATNTIDSGKLMAGAITNSKIANGAVTNDKIQDGEITTTKLQFHLYHYGFDFDFTHNGNDYIVFVEMDTIQNMAISPVFNISDFTYAWNKTYSDTPRRLLAYDNTNNKNVYVELIWDNDNSLFNAHIIDNGYTGVTLTTNDFTLVDPYKTIIF